jgi:hypothetical protein
LISSGHIAVHRVDPAEKPHTRPLRCALATVNGVPKSISFLL